HALRSSPPAQPALHLWRGSPRLHRGAGRAYSGPGRLCRPVGAAGPGFGINGSSPTLRQRHHRGDTHVHGRPVTTTVHLEKEKELFMAITGATNTREGWTASEQA